MTKPPLGRLVPVALREYWAREDTEFTPWLAREDNIALLGEAVSIELEVEAEEAHVGPFRADILCRDTSDGSLVLVENQVERTDHTHLGQVLTYAAGLDAVTIVWIASRLTEEHRAALDWLNEISHEEIRFFGLEVELWQIGDSPAAPKFNVVAKPNDWTRSVRESTSGARGPLSETQQLYQEFWQAFSERATERGSRFALRTTPHESWWNWGVGRTGFVLVARLSVRKDEVAVYLALQGTDATAHLALLEQQREAIERAMGFSAHWLPKPSRKECQVFVSREAALSDRDAWPDLHDWLLDRLAAFDRAFRPRVRALDATEWGDG